MANHTNVASEEHFGAITRVSWGAILAGTVVAMVVQIALALLGLGIGMGVMAPNADAMTGLGIGAGIWLIISTLISLYIGGFVAARLAGLPSKPDGVLNGIVVWALATLLSIYLATSAAGTVVSGISGILGQGIQMAGQGVAAVAPEAAEAVKGNPRQSRQAANEAVDAAKQQYNQVSKQATKALAGAKQEAKQTVKEVAPMASGAALAGFVALLLGAIAGALGGATGAPKNPVVSRSR